MISVLVTELIYVIVNYKNNKTIFLTLAASRKRSYPILSYRLHKPWILGLYKCVRLFAKIHDRLCIELNKGLLCATESNYYMA